jgi:hypothetical protein
MPAVVTAPHQPLPAAARSRLRHRRRPLPAQTHRVQRAGRISRISIVRWCARCSAWRGEPLTIVAIGSSSTAGAGRELARRELSEPACVELKQHVSRRHDITVLNRGINGEETDHMMARFDTDVIAAHPQLVLWQVGTNSVLRDRPLDTHSVQLLHQGIDRAQGDGADVVLIDPQFAPAVIAKPETPDMVEQIALASKEKISICSAASR